MSALTADQARDLSFRLAAAFAARRLYASGNPALQRTLELLSANLALAFAGGAEDVGVALLSQGMSVAGVPLLSPVEGVQKMAVHMRQRGIEIITISRGVSLAELETLFSLLNVDAAQLTAVDVSQWLKDRGAAKVGVKHLELKEGKTVRSMRELYSTGRETLGRELSRLKDKGTLEVGAIQELAGTMLDLVVRSDVPITTLLALRGRDDYTFLHSMNVSLLAGAQASTLGLDEAAVRAIGLAGLVHDVGKTMVPDAVVFKSGALSASEAEMMRNHPGEGARILLRTSGGTGLEAIVANEHHMAYTEDPHIASQLVAIADVFDSIRSLRPFSERTQLRAALRFMLKRMRHRLNPYLLQRFCLMCGMYMPGDEVRLTTGELCRVVANNVELGSKPTVEVVDTAAGRAPPGSVADLSLPHLSELGIVHDRVLAFDDLTPELVDAAG